MSNHESKRRERVLARVKQPDPMYSYCRVFGCGKPATAATGKGLNQRFCRKHEDHYERHGSPYKRSYTAAQLAPHRKAAREWLIAHEEDPVVRLAVNAVVDLYVRAGRRVEAFRLRGLSPGQRARSVWASVRDAGIHPREVVAAWLAVEAAIASDPQAEWKQEFKRVQAAKLIHRMAGGTHKRWEVPSTHGGEPVVTELHKHPHSRGRVLRHLGEQLDRAAFMVTGSFLHSSKRKQDYGESDCGPHHIAS
jgi:hypothetical protein